MLGRHPRKSFSLKYRVADSGEMGKPEYFCEPDEKIVRWVAGTLTGRQEKESEHVTSKYCFPV